MTRSAHLTDALTGVANRAALDVRLPALIRRALRSGQPLCLMLLDLDHFKSVNDAFGHARGDRALTEFARRIRATIRAGDQVFRFGGDEFVVALPGSTLEQAGQVAQRILDEARDRPFQGDPPLLLSVSVGIAQCPEDGIALQELFDVADRRSYQAKRLGRGQAFSSDLPDDLAPTSPERLIERDAAVARVHTFLEEISGQARSLLQISGPAGVGRSRMLAEAAQAAQLRGLPTLSLQGDPALRSRVYGVFAHTQLWPDLPMPALDPAVFVEALRAAVARRGAPALVITIDEADALDRASLELLRLLVAGPVIERLAVIASDLGWAPASYGFPVQSSADQIVLEPLSPDGVRSWLRQALRWEPPADLLAWFCDITGRLPGQIESVLGRLVSHGALVPTQSGWSYRPEAARDASQALTLPQPEEIHALAAGMGDLVGRAAELARLAEALPSHRVVILHGPGGIGKSRLAAQAAAEQAAHFPGGAWWVSLAGLSSARQIGPQIATALALDVAGAEDPLDRLAVTLQDRRTLLVLDNLDQLGDDLGVLVDLLDRLPLMHLLVTARNLPLLPDALALPLGGLATPSEDQGPAVDIYESVQLFAHRAARTDPGFRLDQANRQAVAQICQVVEGMPLGIELAAAQLNFASPHEIAADLMTNLLALSEPGQPGTSGLRIVIEGFWRLLSQHERTVLSRLGIFQGGFRTDAAQAVAEASPFFLNALVASGYLRREPSGRYELHELLRQYAAQQLEGAPSEYARALNRHCSFYTEFAAQREEGLLSTRSAQDQIRMDQRNLQAAWEWAVATGRDEDLARSSLALLRYSLAAGLMPERLEMLTEAVAQLDQRGTSQARVLAILEAHRADALYRLSHFEQAIQAASRASRLAQSIDDPGTTAFALLARGNALIVRTESVAAHADLNQALALSRTAGVRWLEATILTTLGYTANSLRRYAEARDLLRQALAIFQSLGDRRDEAMVLNGLGNLAEDRGDPSAQQFYEQALRLYRALGDRDGESGVLHNLGVVAILLGQYAQARTVLEEAMRGFHKIGSRFGEAITHYNLGRIARETGAWDEAEEHFNASLAMTRAIGNREVEAAILNARALNAALRGDVEHARARYAEALWLARAIRDQRNLSRSLAGAAHVQARAGRPRAALRAARRALRLATVIDHPLFQSDALSALANAYRALGDRVSAEDAIGQARAILRELGLDPAIHLRASWG